MSERFRIRHALIGAVLLAGLFWHWHQLAEANRLDESYQSTVYMHRHIFTDNPYALVQP